MKKIAIVVDGSNHGIGMIAAGFRTDYTKLRKFFADQGDLVASLYFTALPPAGEPSSIRRLTDNLSYSGWRIISKEMKIWTDNGVTRKKGNMDQELTMACVRMALAKSVTDIILLSGDGDFASMVEFVQEHGVRVTVISHRSILSDELRRNIFEYIDLESLRPYVEMELTDRQKAEQAERRKKFLDGR